MKPFSNLYFLLITPSSKVISDVIQFKLIVKKLLGRSYRSLHSVPHLTLLQFEDIHNESKLFDYDRMVSRVAPFNIHIDGFGAFQRNGTLYLKTVFDDETRRLAAVLRKSAIVPHITIARRLAPHDIEHVWNYFRQITYRHSFRCDRVTVLKRKNERWHSHAELWLKDIHSLSPRT